MKSKIKTWALRLAATSLISVFTIVAAVFNPGVLYANKTTIGNYTIRHHQDLDSAFGERLSAIDKMVKASAIYDPNFEIEICLNDGSLYPEMMRKLRGIAFGWGFSNKAVLYGKADFKKNRVHLNGYDWNLEQLFVHEITHCMQHNHFGWLNSNPLAGHPEWKWEGYAEYASRKGQHQSSLTENIERVALARQEKPEAWGILFEDSTIAPRVYYDHWLLMQYALNIKNMSYDEVITSELSEKALREEMQDWYLHQ